MAQRMEIRLPRPLASVAVAGGGHCANATNEPQPRAAAQAELDRNQAAADRALLRSAAAAMQAAADRFGQMQEQFHAHAEAQLLELSLEIARKVLMQEIKAERHEIDPIVREALSRIPPRTEVVVHLNPADMERCKLARQAEQPAAAAAMRFIADPKVPPAGCLLQTAQGTVESSVEEHLGEVAEALASPE